MSVEQIDQVFWYQKRNCMVVTYRDGEADRAPATVSAAASLAEDAQIGSCPDSARRGQVGTKSRIERCHLVRLPGRPAPSGCRPQSLRLVLKAR